jgi:hypothetical protein
VAVVVVVEEAEVEEDSPDFLVDFQASVEEVQVVVAVEEVVAFLDSPDSVEVIHRRRAKSNFYIAKMSFARS